MDENQQFVDSERGSEQRKGRQFVYLLIGLVFVVLVAIGVVGYFVIVGETGKSSIEEDEREVLRTEFYGEGEEGYALEWYMTKGPEDVIEDPEHWRYVDEEGRVQEADLVFIDEGGGRDILAQGLVETTQELLPPEYPEQSEDIRFFAHPEGSQKIILMRIAGPGPIYVMLFSYDKESNEVRFMEITERLPGTAFTQYISPDETKFFTMYTGSLDSSRNPFPPNTTDIFDLVEDSPYVTLTFDVRENESLTFGLQEYGGTRLFNMGWLDDSTIRYGVFDANKKLEPDVRVVRDLIEYRTVNIEEQQKEREVHLEYLDDGTVLQVVDGEGNEVLRYSIEEFNQWSAQNWDNVFSERPAFGELGKVSPAGFSRFDETASLSPFGDRLAFSVGEYRALTTASFVGVLDIESGDVDLVDSVKWGDIEKIIWSFGGDHVAYLLHTARARGDLLSIDNVASFSNEVTLEGEDIIAALDREEQINPSEYMPHFDGLMWTGTGRVGFSSDVPGGEEERRGWFIQSDGTDLR